MSTIPPTVHGTPNTPASTIRSRERRLQARIDLDRHLPAAPSSLPNNYETPSLRRVPRTETNPSSHVSHLRSFSHPFPALFGSRRQERKVKQPTDGFDSSNNAGQSKQKGSKHHKSNEKDNKTFVTGTCMTCNTTVRWPQEVKVFRCTTCWTINDLEPLAASATHMESSTSTYHKPLFISLEKTRDLIDSCIEDFFRFVLDQKMLLNPDSNEAENIVQTEELAAEDHDTEYPSPGFGVDVNPIPSITVHEQSQPQQSTLLTPPSQPPGLLADNQINDIQGSKQFLRPNSFIQLEAGSNQSVQQPRLDRALFRGVESYIASCLTGCTLLNNSFFLNKQASTREARSTRRRHVKQQPSEIAITPASEHEAFLSELDAKTLLLGDVAGNGSWWMGEINGQDGSTAETPGERLPERSKSSVSARSSRINWLELTEWYRIVVRAGDDWHKRWMNFGSTLTDSELEKWHSVPLGYLGHVIIDSQTHLQRSLLKACENLLKRPGQPLQNPADCRFLLILLANPLLSPVTENNTSRCAAEEKAENNIPMQKSPFKAASSVNRFHGNLGRHSGIVKRILGLLAHLSNETHLYLVAWFARFSDSHLTGLVDLISSFVTYRLIRQSSKPVQKLPIDPTEGLIPNFSEGGLRHASQMHAALEGRSNSTQRQKQDGKPQLSSYGEDWQIKAAARIMALLFQANTGHSARKRDNSISLEQRSRSAGLSAKHHAHVHGQMIPISNFYNSMLDHADLIADFEAWETTRSKFTFCQYPCFLSIWAKIHILEHDARRQMEAKAKEAFFDSILTRKAVSQYFVLKVRRDCLVDDSLKSVSEAIGRGDDDVKKGLRIDFVGEDGVDAGGLRKEWFLLLVREIFNPNHGLFVYDEESQYCYFNPFCLESSEQFFLVGILLGLAIYNSTILDVAFPPFVFKKMLASGPSVSDKLASMPKISHQCSLDDLAELRPSLARGLRQLIEFEGDVQETFCRDFVVDMERYGGVVQIPLCSGGASRPVTNANRREFVDLYVHYLLDQSVARQYEPFKRGFFTVCGGNALSLFRPEEIELLVRGSDEPLDVNSLRAVASYEGWPKNIPVQEQPQVVWFWEFFQQIAPDDQRKMLSFITGSDRIPAMGATNLIIRLQLLTDATAEDTDAECQRLPISRTCFNLLGLYRYKQRKTLEEKLWTAVTSAEGFGLK